MFIKLLGSMYLIFRLLILNLQLPESEQQRRHDLHAQEWKDDQV